MDLIQFMGNYIVSIFSIRFTYFCNCIEYQLLLLIIWSTQLSSVYSY